MLVSNTFLPPLQSLMGVFSILCKCEEEGVEAPKTSFVASFVLRAIICVNKALSTFHCLGGCNFGAELGTKFVCESEDLTCNSPLRCCDLQFKFHFGIQIYLTIL